MGNQDSWRKSAANRRDSRNEKTDDQPKKIAAKKDTKKWCKGKVGVEHKPKCYPYNSSFGIKFGWYTLSCEVCGRQLDFSFFPRDNKPTPDLGLRKMNKLGIRK